MGPGPDILNKFSLEASVAVVTGAASGLGQESARILAQAGAHVILSDINIEGLAATADLIRKESGMTTIIPANVAHQKEVDALAENVITQLGRLDIWVNSAGIPLVSPILETTGEAADKVINVNMMGTYWGCAAAARAMKPRGRGAIINISSGGGDAPVPNLSVYGMTKAAVNHLTRIAAHEFGGFGIRVNAIAPGWIETPMGADLYRSADGNIDPELRAKVRRDQAAATPLGTNGTPTDIAMALLYLATDASSFVTGQVIRVNGGLSM